MAKSAGIRRYARTGPRCSPAAEPARLGRAAAARPFPVPRTRLSADLSADLVADLAADLAEDLGADLAADLATDLVGGLLPGRFAAAFVGVADAAWLVVEVFAGFRAVEAATFALLPPAVVALPRRTDVVAPSVATEPAGLSPAGPEPDPAAVDPPFDTLTVPVLGNSLIESVTASIGVAVAASSAVARGGPLMARISRLTSTAGICPPDRPPSA